MSGSDTTIAAAALSIALVALLTAVGQLLGQYFATADGYRRCHKSVMGEYAKRTRLHWRWREFRFETLYTTPEIFLAGDGALSRKGQVVLTGSNLSREKSLVPLELSEQGDLSEEGEWIADGPQLQSYHGAVHTCPEKVTSDTKQTWSDRGDIACWVPFLNWVHESSQATLGKERIAGDPVDFPPYKVRLPVLIFRERSWDFQPPDVVRPLAKSTLSDIAIIARRMGMKWKDFRPADGILRAEGHSHIITSTVVRSLGIVLQYSYTGQHQRLRLAEHNLRRPAQRGSIVEEREEIYIPRARADRLGCGVLRGECDLGIPDMSVSTQQEIIKALTFLDRSGESSIALTKRLQKDPDFQFRIADLVAFTTPPARYRGSSLVQIPAPSDNVCGVTSSPVGRKAFREGLQEHIRIHHGDVGEQTQRVLSFCRDIGARFDIWDGTDESCIHPEPWTVTRNSAYLDAVHEQVYVLTKLLHDWEQQPTFRYITLLGIHIRFLMFAEDGETSMQRNLGQDYKADVDGYFRNLGKVVEEMRKTGFIDRQMIVDAWVVMMLRAMCWGACHFFVPGERVPIQYFGSQLPVYIG